MDTLDKSLSTLIQQIESIDGKKPATMMMSGTGGGVLDGSSSSTTMVSQWLRRYFFYWTMLLFLTVVILVIRPSNVYVYNPVTRQTHFSFSAFLLTLTTTYGVTLVLHYLHHGVLA